MISLTGFACSTAGEQDTGAGTETALEHPAADREPPVTDMEPPVTEDKDDQKYIAFDREGIKFIYPQSIAGGTTIEALDGYEDEMWFSCPDYVMVSFENYILDNTFHSPALMIFPLEEYRQVCQYAGQIIASLEEIIAGSQNMDSAAEMPFLPQWNAAQQFHSNIVLLQYDRVSGLRYLTQYVQDYVPVTNDTLIYTFQGITADKKYYISLIMPVSHPGLPADWDDYYDSIGGDYQGFYDDYFNYLDLTIALLEVTADNLFTPSLVKLDGIVETLQVE